MHFVFFFGSVFVKTVVLSDSGLTDETVLFGSESA